ncbi:Spermidine synthase family protein [Granulibacter bethesdensis]|uniref:Spermidine synthase family protein n=1 Tax=Granulibacter bethesdensis TaxID=364410 RepID=A0AAN0REC4_9PROT|nr:fused MFS/spermidine synthase [Granulibacter bethesdensis]AHJ63315.1 Spermidine synthase family protein [Granulibacter bethesdensis]
MIELAATSSIAFSAFGDITIGCDPGTGAHIYWQRGACQSEADAQGVSYAPYAHALFGFLMQTDAGLTEPVLMIGCGGGSLATMLHRAGRAVEIVDIDPVSFELARSHFGLPSGIPCHIADGVAFLQAINPHQRYGAIIVDAFHGSEVPPHFLDLSFFQLCATRLQGGFVVMNVLETTANRVALSCLFRTVDAWLQQEGQNLRLFEEGMCGEQNLLLLTGNVHDLSMPELLMPPHGAAEEIREDLARMRFRPDLEPPSWGVVP